MPKRQPLDNSTLRGFWDSRDTSSFKYLFDAQQWPFFLNIAALLMALILTESFLNRSLSDRIHRGCYSLINLFTVQKFLFSFHKMFSFLLQDIAPFHTFHLQKELSLFPYHMIPVTCLIMSTNLFK